MQKRNLLFLGIFLFSVFSLVNASQWGWRDANNVIKGWFNSTGSLNITEDFICPNCINSEDVNDIDDADIETDLNTYVDIAGDTMTDDLIMNAENITFTTGGIVLKGNFTYNNGTCVIIKGPTSTIEVC